MRRWQRPVPERTRFLRFIAAGGTSSLANAASRWLFSQALSYEIAVVLAYIVGMMVAFVLMRQFVFEGTRGTRAAGDQAIRFIMVNIGSLAQVWIISVGLARVIFPALGFDWHAETIAHIAGLGSLTVTSYIAHKRFSFAPAGGPARVRDQPIPRDVQHRSF
jgi:putative flippase GtrA